MLPRRKAIRRRLLNCSRADFDKLILDANLNCTQKQILDMFISDGLTICEIAYRLEFCESNVRKILAGAYDKIAFL